MWKISGFYPMVLSNSSVSVLLVDMAEFFRDEEYNRSDQQSFQRSEILSLSLPPVHLV